MYNNFANNFNPNYQNMIPNCASALQYKQNNLYNHIFANYINGKIQLDNNMQNNLCYIIKLICQYDQYGESKNEYRLINLLYELWAKLDKDDIQKLLNDFKAQTNRYLDSKIAQNNMTSYKPMFSIDVMSVSYDDEKKQILKSIANTCEVGKAFGNNYIEDICGHKKNM